MLRASQGGHDLRAYAIGISKCPFGNVKLSTYLSLNAAPVFPFPVTEMIASSKFHDEAASATPAPKSSNEGINERKNRIIKLYCCRVEIRGASRPRTVERCLSEFCRDRLRLPWRHFSLASPFPSGFPIRTSVLTIQASSGSGFSGSWVNLSYYTDDLRLRSLKSIDQGESLGPI